jgi:hypothetical protein
MTDKKIPFIKQHFFDKHLRGLADFSLFFLFQVFFSYSSSKLQESFTPKGGNVALKSTSPQVLLWCAATQT